MVSNEFGYRCVSFVQFSMSTVLNRVMSTHTVLPFLYVHKYYRLTVPIDHRRPFPKYTPPPPPLTRPCVRSHRQFVVRPHRAMSPRRLVHLDQRCRQYPVVHPRHAPRSTLLIRQDSREEEDVARRRTVVVVGGGGWWHRFVVVVVVMELQMMATMI